jgi:hypothetical protein
MPMFLFINIDGKGRGGLEPGAGAARYNFCIKQGNCWSLFPAINLPEQEAETSVHFSGFKIGIY